ncbi:unnamed protein product [Diatraea saccharalis]|uniref:FP protein N-terminal domain-containing protein n=1 Tax=Diatraea saccharalis TaxID=40085 RepID=A0A9N9R7B2_9NEOP|nr:unnamed protein product [Diatraea saccharalis]
MKQELSSISQNLEYTSEKLDEVLEGMEAIKTTIKDLKKKNEELTNKCNNMQTRVGALEQRMHQMEQERLFKTIDVYNLPIDDRTAAQKAVHTLAEKLQLQGNDVTDLKCFPATKDRAGKIQIVLEKESVQTQWLQKAKTTKITVADVIPTATEHIAKETVYISESLTPFNKVLLRNAGSSSKKLECINMSGVKEE